LWLYTNRGLGTTNVPVRVNCAPEITELTLVNA
jgi:predicted MPP superfamily phosphohydrolase